MGKDLSMDATEKLLQEITDANGPSGFEDGAREVMARYSRGLGAIDYDRLGSLIVKKKGKSDSPRVLIAGHLDEIGFMVKEITSEGYIKFLTLGGWWPHVVLGQRVRIITKKGPVIGVIGSQPPHILKDEDRKKVMKIEDMFIDVGTMKGYDITKKLGVRVGDPIVPDSDFTIMNNKQMYMAKAFDNRMSCAIVVDVLKKFKSTPHPNTIYGVGTVQEEVGARGATTIARKTQPDVAFIVDVGVALDVPPNDFNRVERLGNGASLLIYEGSMIPNHRLREMIMETAESKKIPYNLASMPRGGSDGGPVHKSGFGVPSIYMGVPTRYIHAHNGIIYRKDYDNTVKLIVETIKRIDKKALDKLIKY